MTTFDTFDPHRWLASHTRIASYNTEDLQPVMWFTLIWNRFEFGLLDCYASLPAIDRCVSTASASSLLHWEDFDDCWNCLKKHLESRGALRNLEFFLLSEQRPDADEARDKARASARVKEKDRIKSLLPILEGERPDIETAMREMLFIAYRIRNNLFHGEKCVTSLPKQRDLVTTLAFILAKYIDISKPLNSKI